MAFNYNPDYVPTGPANRVNPYEMKVNHSRLAKADGTPRLWLGTRGGVFPAPGGITEGLVAWYDPSDTDTLFKEVGNTATNYTISKAATSAGDPVGLMLDKSQGLVQGDNLLDGVAATFARATAVANGAGFDLTATSTFATLVYAGIVEAGAVYAVKGRFSGNDEQRRIALSAGGAYYQLTIGGVSALVSGEFEVIVAGSDVNTDMQFYAADSASGETFYFELESVREIAGNHLSQATAAARPTYQTDGTLHWLQGDGVDDELAASNPELGFGDFLISSAFRITLPGASTFPTVVAAGSTAVGQWMLRKVEASTALNLYASAGDVTTSVASVGAAEDEVASVRRNAEGTRIVRNVDESGVLDATDDFDLTSATTMTLFCANAETSRRMNGRIYGVAIYKASVTDGSRVAVDTYMMEKAGLA